jgi:hypothetical protein
MSSTRVKNLRIRPLSDKEDEMWDEFVNASPQGDVFHLSFYLRAWEVHDPEIHLLRLGCFDAGNNLVGGQAFLHKIKAGFLRVQCLLQTWTHIETPLVAEHISAGGDEYLQVTNVLAASVKKLFLDYRGYFHPSLTDIRAYLYGGYRARPDYAHGWDLTEVQTLLHSLKQLRRFKKAELLHDELQFSVEHDLSIIDEFIPMYESTSQQLNFSLRPSFAKVFRDSAVQMMSRGLIRFFSCKNKNGEMLGIATYTVNPRKKRAYSWQVAYNYSHGAQKDFMPALDLFTIEELSREVNFIDLGEGMRPSMYFNKDALLTRSCPYYVVEVEPSALGVFYERARKFKNRVVHSIGKG